MIYKKDIDGKWTRQIDIALQDIEDIKDQIITLNNNDGVIEENLLNALKTVKTELAEKMNSSIKSINDLIDKQDEDTEAIYSEFKKIYSLIELKEKESIKLFNNVKEISENALKGLGSADGYIKRENGKLVGVKLPEDRIFSEDYFVETVREVIHEQPIIQQVEVEKDPVLTKSMMEHYFNFGNKLSEEVMAPKYIQGYDKLQIDKEAENYFNSDKRILYFDFIRNLLLVLLDNGVAEITNTVKGTTIFKGNIIEEIKAQLSIDVCPMEITTIHPSGPGFYIATLNNGVLFYNIVDKTLSLKMSDNGVVYIDVAGDKTLVISECISIYNEEGLRTYNTRILRDKNLKPITVEKISNNRLVILCSGEQKGLNGNVFLYGFKNGEIERHYIYEDPYDRRDVYFYDVISDSETLSLIGNRDGDYVSYIYDIDKLGESYRVRSIERESGLQEIIYNTSNDDYLMAFFNKIILNGKYIYGLNYEEDRKIIFKDKFVYLIYDKHVDRLNIELETGNVFKFPINILGEGYEPKLIIKRDSMSAEIPVVRVPGKVLKTYTLLDYIYVDGIVSGDHVELNINGSIIDDIAVYSEYSVSLKKEKDDKKED